MYDQCPFFIIFPDFSQKIICPSFFCLTCVGSAWSFVVLIPASTANDFLLRRISIPDRIHYIIFLSYFLRKSQYFPFQCWVLNKGTTGTIFITSLVWRSPWLGIEPGTSRSRSQYSSTRLSRRRYIFFPDQFQNDTMTFPWTWKKPCHPGNPVRGQHSCLVCLSFSHTETSTIHRCTKITDKISKHILTNAKYM